MPSPLVLPLRPCTCAYPACQRPTTCFLRHIITLLNGENVVEVAGSQAPPDRQVMSRIVDSRSGNGAHVPLPEPHPDEDFLSWVASWRGGS